jgi:hypothetical protein
MRMIPSRPGHGLTGSEVEVYNLLNLVEFGDEAVAFSSLNLAEHDYKKWGEIDFVILSTLGLIVIEVKGGFVSTDSRGIWRYESRGRQTVERLESPMAQASSAYFSLVKSHIDPAVGSSAFKKVPSGFCTILAKTPLVAARALTGGPEMPVELVGSSEDLRSPAALSDFIDRVLDYWRNRPPYAVGEWSKTEVELIGKTLRPCFERVPPLSLSAARIRQEQFALTEEQYRTLDFADRAPRLMCTGGAGCGKTLLAMECLRRERASDPVLVTGTPSLAAHLRASAPADAARILSIDEVRAGRAGNRRYGSMIVDEGQQITDTESIKILGARLTGGIEGGRWRWFADPNNQVLKNGSFDPVVHAWLESQSYPGSLTRNCRNTPQIVSMVETLTGADAGSRQMAGHGPAVEFAVGDSTDERVLSAARKVKEWLRDPDIQPSQIVILSPNPLELSVAGKIAEAAAVPLRRWRPGWDTLAGYPRTMGFATIDEFRGLETPFLILSDMDAGIADVARWFYLGLTRANFSAFVVADPRSVADSVQSVHQQKKGSMVAGAPR